MKKTMITLAATFAAAVSMAAVTSQVVGYQTIDALAGFTTVAPTFNAIGGEAPTYGSIKGAFDPFAGDNLQFFDVDGNVEKTIYWFTTDLGVDADGWYDEANNLVDNQAIPSGTAFFASVSAGGAITFSGAVPTNTVVINLNQGFTCVGNPFPVPLAYQDLQFSAVDPFSGDSLQFFDVDGNVEKTVYWFTTDLGVDVDGWYDDSNTLVSADLIPAGGAFFASIVAGGTLTIPGIQL